MLSKQGYIVELYFTFSRSVPQGQSVYNYITCPLPPAAKCILGEDSYDVFCGTGGFYSKVATFIRNSSLIRDEQHINALKQAESQNNSLYYPFPYLTPFANENNFLTIPLPRSSYVLSGLVAPYPVLYMKAEETLLPLYNGALIQKIEVIAHVIWSQEKMDWLNSQQNNLIKWYFYCSYTGESFNFLLHKDKVRVLDTLTVSFEEGQTYIPTTDSRLTTPKFYRLDYDVSTDLQDGYLFQHLSDAYVEAKTILYDAGDPNFIFSMVELTKDYSLPNSVHNLGLHLPFNRILTNLNDYNGTPIREFIPHSLYKLEKPLPFKFSTFFKAFWESSTPKGGLLKVGNKTIVKENFNLVEVSENDIWKKWRVEESQSNLPTPPFRLEGLKW